MLTRISTIIAVRHTVVTENLLPIKLMVISTSVSFFTSYESHKKILSHTFRERLAWDSTAVA